MGISVKTRLYTASVISTGSSWLGITVKKMVKRTEIRAHNLIVAIFRAIMRTFTYSLNHDMVDVNNSLAKRDIYISKDEIISQLKSTRSVSSSFNSHRLLGYLLC